ncbi:hypothetical protein [Vulcanisaeta souniana]|uniref:Uncharacterized protein n=1 Tax=Vulcanisaeta souniana JCM 11219 TaxID=1293586 RepID=A0A830E9M3_9CREN|nr:hypothetical protein [Vulcanisaeta souniana]BDR92645.1 hypothetical protein Vsou_17380 [Vulcanisaeta souniana JCM 11219]GGI84666.1 hypothetical protein GCM10007112_22080 [Vulcanisaeta souniana JCM 11219]
MRSQVIRLASDVGELRIWLATLVLSRPMNDELLSRVKSIISGCRDSLITIVPARMILNPWQMMYPAYLSLREHLMGVSRFRDVGLGALTYMAGTTQLRRGLSLLNPVGHDQVSIIIMGVDDCVDRIISDVIRVLNDRIMDAAIGVGIHRSYTGIFNTIDEFINTLISRYIGGLT